MANNRFKAGSSHAGKSTPLSAEAGFPVYICEVTKGTQNERIKSMEGEGPPPPFLSRANEIVPGAQYIDLVGSNTYWFSESGWVYNEDVVGGGVGSISGKEDKSNKGIPNGYASLDNDGKVPLSELPTIEEGSETFTFNGTTDTINHGKNTSPFVLFVDSDGNERDVDVEYIDANNVKITSNESISGVVTLSY